uniref:Uncharacterized protein n=1 Tax=Bombyx mori TaxID=7091 RepID=A0A8R1WN72_BOMMO|nr:uncharacterized protein LOC101743237 [Bombyx mori]
MNILGYLIAVAHMQALNGSRGPHEDILTNIGTLDSLAHQIREQNLLSLEGFKSSGFSRNGNKGYYLSRNLRDYIYYKVGNPTDEGVFLTILYKDQDTNKNVPALFVSKVDVNDEIREAINDYVNKL